MRYIILLFSFSTLCCFSQDVREPYQRAAIYFDDSSSIPKLVNLGVAIDHGIHPTGRFVISDFSVSEIVIAKSAGYHVEILIEDSRAYILENNYSENRFNNNLECPDPLANIFEYITPNNFHLGSMGGYLTYSELLDELDEMRILFPNLISEKENIHDFLTEGEPDNSTNPPIGGNGIKWVKISDHPEINSEGEPQILYTALHHAREPTSLSQLVYFMWYLLENYETNPEIKNIIDNSELYFIPVVNPDGYLYNEKTDPNGGGFWRKNRKNGHGVDNNRNYDYYIGGDPNNGTWGGEGSSSDPNSNTYHGTLPFSEAENQAMKWFLENHDIKIALNNHSAGKLLLYPFAYTENALTEDDNVFRALSNELVSQNGYTNIQSSELYPAAGAAEDFMYGTIGTHDKVFSLTPEIGTSFYLPTNEIEGTCKEMMYLNLSAARMLHNYATIEENSELFIGDQIAVLSPVTLKRLGLLGNGNFTVTLNPISQNITSVGPPLQLNELEILEEIDGFLSYTLEEDIAYGDTIDYELIINNGFFESKSLIQKKFGAYTLVFESLGNSVTEYFISDGWDITTATFVSPSSSITDSPIGNYGNNADETLTLKNEINLSQAIGAEITFQAKWDVFSFDYVQFEISIDNGNSWIPQCGNLTEIFFFNDEPIYEGIQEDWAKETIYLDDYLGENVLFRFELHSNAGGTSDGFYFDDLKVNIVREFPLSIEENETASFVVYPNPVLDILNITTPQDNYSIELYTIQGQLVSSSENNSGSQTLDYSNLSGGIYLLRLTSSEASQTLRIVKR